MNRARSQAAKDARRQTLLSAALDEFYEKGFSAARMDDIAARAGLSKGTLYLYFASKDALFTDLIESLTEPNLMLLESVAGDDIDINEAVQQVCKLAPLIVRESELPRLMKVLVSDSQQFPETLRAYRKNVIERVLGILTKVLTTASQRGDIEIGDPSLTARLVVAPIVFSSLWQSLFLADADARFDLDRLFQLHADMLIKGMAVTGEP